MAIDQAEFEEKVSRTFDVFRHEFLPRIKITSKDMMEPSPMTLYQSQDFALTKIEEGLKNGVHDHKFLKARQLGITTAFLPLDIFWLYTNPGLQGALILDSGDNKETMRETITQMLESLPKAFKVPIRSHNRNALVLVNGSRLQYMAAGRGRNSSLGRSRALNFIHSSECSSWGDQKGLDSLRAAISQRHPNRLYLWESTALGQNLWFDMCQDAKDDPAQAFHFIGWWMKDTYKLLRDTADYAYWWGGSPFLTEDEQEKGQYVLTNYGYQITTEQWAWYRKQAREQSDEESLFREFPSTELESWITTGSPYFKAKSVTEDMLMVRQVCFFNAYNVKFGLKFSNLEIVPVTNATDCDLRVWEEPKKGARYVIGMDVAYGLSEINDRTVISVWRCFSDRMVQVAEYATSMPETEQVTWVLAYLAGCYRDCRVNLEINGPGMQVFNNLKHMKQQLGNNVIRDIPFGLNTARSLDTMRWYLYHRPDSMGAGYCYNFKMGHDLKLNVMSGMRDHYNMGRMLVRSIPLMNEMLTLKQEGDSIAASGRNKDDRVIAAALASHAWSEWVRPGMEVDRRDYKTEMANQSMREKSDKVIDHIVPNFLAARKEERDAAAWARALGG